MRYSTRISTFLIAVLAITATSCYTQLKTTYDSYPASGYYSSDDDRAASGDRSLEDRGDQVVNEEDYTLGYDDGWSDAEAYYFKDYEAKRWYEEYGATLAHDPYVRHYTVNHYRYGRGYSPFHSYYYPHYPYYSHANSWRFSLGFHVGWGWNHWYPRYAYHPFYDYYAYPFYPYYGGYWGSGYHHPYYGNNIVIYNGSRGTNRNYGPRSNGLTSRGANTVRRTRSEARAGNTANRSDVRSNARSRHVSGSRSRGTVNRSSGTTRSRSGSSSTVRSRSGSSNSSGSVNRGSSGRSRSSGSVNRSRSSSSSRSNGSVNRSRSSSRGNGTVKRSRSSSRGNNRSLSSSSGSSVSGRSSSATVRKPLNSRSTYIGRNYNNLSVAARDDVTTKNSHLSRRERALKTIRNQVSSQSLKEVSARNVNRSKSSGNRWSKLLNNRTARSLYKTVIGSNGSNSRRSSVQRSGTRSSGRSSSVSRSRSNSSSRSSVRSSRSSSSSSKSRGSSSRSRSSSSRDRN